jgi:PadR family transcriptional regulator PadR
MEILCGTHCVSDMPNDATLPQPLDETVENLRLELRRGALVIAVLARLKTEHYGYALRKALGEQGMDIEENTLYPLLRRLETQGLLDSAWREEDRRNKRFYRLSADGALVLDRLLQQWADIEASLHRIIEEDPS